MPGVALAHDYLLVMRGAERTFAAMAESGRRRRSTRCSTTRTARRAASPAAAVRTSYLQRLGVRPARLPAAAAALSGRGASGCDLSGTTASCPAAARSRTACGAPGAAHVCYCHSPFRYAWHERARALAEVPAPAAAGAALALRRHPALRPPRAARSVDALHRQLASITRARIRRYWGRDAPIVHPPVDVERFASASRARTLCSSPSSSRHKRVELALEAARRRAARSGSSATARSSSGCARRYAARRRVPRARRGRGCGPVRPRRARSSCRTWRSSGSPPSRRRRPAGR